MTDVKTERDYFLTADGWHKPKAEATMADLWLLAQDLSRRLDRITDERNYLRDLLLAQAGRTSGEINEMNRDRTYR